MRKCERQEDFAKFFFLLCGSPRSLTVSVAGITQPVTSIFHTAVSVSGNFAALISYLGQREAIAGSLSCLSGLFHNTECSFFLPVMRSYSPGGDSADLMDMKIAA